MSILDVDDMSEMQAKSLLEKLIERLEQAENEGIFGTDSWEGFLDIEDDS